MFSTGMVKKIDNLGRIVLPKELRRKLKIRENDELEMFLENDDTIVLRKYSTMNDIKNDCNIYAELLTKETNFKVMFTDKEKVTICKGKNTAHLIGEEISEKVIEIMDGRMLYNINITGNIKVLKNNNETIFPQIISPLIVDSKCIGSIILFSDTINTNIKEKEYELVKFISSLITLKLEI